MKLKIGVFTSILILCALFVFLWTFGFVGLWSDGIGYIINEKEKYVSQNIPIDDNYEIIIDLANLDANKDKVVYNDGECKVIIYSVDNTGEARSGGYRVHFRAIGEYSVNGAKLVSGTCYQYSKNGIFTDMTAKLTVSVNGHSYECDRYGSGGEKTGNIFSFYLFPIELYESGEITLDEQGTTTITLSDLSKSIWTKR